MHIKQGSSVVYSVISFDLAQSSVETASSASISACLLRLNSGTQIEFLVVGLIVAGRVETLDLERIPLCSHSGNLRSLDQRA